VLSSARPETRPDGERRTSTADRQRGYLLREPARPAGQLNGPA
jgi:hypothetical protein